MDIKNFKTFKKIVETGSFSKAAEQLGYAQSTITFHIQSIEGYYRRPLFNRVGNAVELTDFGQNIVSQVDALLDAYEAVEGASAIDMAPQGSIRIGTPESLLLYRLYDIIREYKQTYPQVEIVISIDLCPTIRDKVLKGELDLGILLQPEYQYSQLNTTLLKKEEMCFVAPKDYTGDDFLPRGSQMVLYTEKECTYREVFQNYLQGQKFYPTNVLETGSVEVIKKYIQYGMGISYLPLYAVEEDARRGKLRIKKHDSPVEFFTQVVCHKSKWLSPAVQAFVKMCGEQAKGW
jgi:DNA-binding transcriptional LysR family regulator